MKIVLLHDSETLRYAADELAKYIKMMDERVCVSLIREGEVDEGTVRLGLLKELSLPDNDVNDPMIDDVIDININCLSGYIGGSNDRSVLMGVYNFLKSAGCRWVRPGDKGEYIPKCDISSHCFKYRKKADNSFRGQCIEGAVSFEHVRDTILWLPKVNMNMFMMEQIVPYNYMSRWYNHVVNTKRESENLPYEKYCEYCLELEHTVKKLGLQLHALGHGATLEPFGVRHMMSGMDYDIPEDVKKAFALVKGKRELYGRSPFYTQICMSQKWVRDKVVNWLADYLESKPHIDFLHFWLGDNVNNHCECEDCVKHHPSDLYVVMLNQLDEILKERKNNAKIVFIMYTDTMWPPIKEKLNNPSRFIVTTATTRAMGDKYSSKRSENGIPEWTRNQFSIPAGFETTLSFVDAWKKVFDGVKFIYEYYMYTDHFSDPGYMIFSRAIAEDMKSIHLTGFNGVMSDQTQRAFFPTGLPNTVIGEFLFDKELDTEAFIDKYMMDSFGEDHAIAKEYLESISGVFANAALKIAVSVVAQDTGANDGSAKKAGIIGNKELGRAIATVPGLVDRYEGIFKQNAEMGDKCHRESYRILTYHCEYCKHLSKISCALADDDRKRAMACLGEAIEYLSTVEPEIHQYFDLVLFNQRTRQTIQM